MKKFIIYNYRVLCARIISWKFYKNIDHLSNTRQELINFRSNIRLYNIFQQFFWQEWAVLFYTNDINHRELTDAYKTINKSRTLLSFLRKYLKFSLKLTEYIMCQCLDNSFESEQIKYNNLSALHMSLRSSKAVTDNEIHINSDQNISNEVALLIDFCEL